MITKPGIFYDMPSADYFADPCPSPSLTQSLAKIIINQSPLHAWHAHPRLNPDYRHDDDTKFDVGNVAHKLMLGRGKEIVVLDMYDDWRKKAAQEARAEALAEGKHAILGKHFARADRMVRAAREQIDLRGLDFVFSDGGESEVCLAWKEGDIWLRQLVDWMSLRSPGGIIADYKTTDMVAAPHALSRMMVNAGWPIQAAMTDRALNVLDPKSAGKRDYLFVVQEAEPPYCLTVAAMTEAALTMGRKQLEHAISLWTDCVKRDRWPGYPAEVEHPEYPGWHEAQWLGREIEHESRQQSKQASNFVDQIV